MTEGIDNTDAGAGAGVRERPSGVAPVRPPEPAASVQARPAATTAILLATAAARDGGPAAALPWDGGTLLARLVDQLASLDVVDVHVITRPGFQSSVRSALAESDAELVTSVSVAGDLRAVAEIAAAAAGGVVVALADVATQREALAGLLVDPRHPSGVLASAGVLDAPLAPRTRSRRGRLVSADSAYHAVDTPNHRFLGIIKLASADRAALAEVAGELAELASPPLPRAWRKESEAKEGVSPDDATALLLVGLVRSGVQLGNSFIRTLFWDRPLSGDAARRARVQIEDHDEDRALLDSAVKASDGFFTSFFVSPYSKYIARWAARRGYTPNQVTTVSMAIGVLAAAAFATGERWGLIAGAVLLQVAFTFDCVDGQLARYTRTFTKLGAWLDSIFDRTKEYLVFAGLAIGASRTGQAAWLLAGAALTLQTARHAMEFSWGATMHQNIGATEHPPLSESHDSDGLRRARRRAARADGGGATASGGGSSGVRALLGRVVAAWTVLDHHPRFVWVKRIIAFPIGERFAAISLTAALTTPRTTLIVVLACNGFAASYSATGRVLRSIAA